MVVRSENKAPPSHHLNLIRSQRMNHLFIIKEIKLIDLCARVAIFY